MDVFKLRTFSCITQKLFDPRDHLINALAELNLLL